MTKELLKRLDALEKKVSSLESENADLRRRLGMDSSNSSKPPSSDGLKKNLRKKRSLGNVLKEDKKKEKPPQKPLEQTTTPDETVDSFPETCKGCRHSLENVPTERLEKRQVFDLPRQPKPHVVEYRSHAVFCPNCGAKNKGAFPENITAHVSFGNGVKAAAAYLSAYQFVPEERLSETFRDLFGINAGEATLAKFVAETAEKLKNTQEKTLETLKTSPVKHMDETGFRIGGKTQWLHVVSNLHLTHYRVSAKRGELLDGVSGTAVVDFWKPYLTLKNVLHGFCNAHLLRELIAVSQNEGLKWAKNMMRLLLFANKSAKSPPNFKKSSKRVDIKERIRRLYDKIVAAALEKHSSMPELAKKTGRGPKKRRPGHNLALRFRDFKEGVLRFLSDPEVPFTNNLAERDLRMMKVKQKISGCFRSENGARNFAVLRGFLSTVKKQGKNPFEEVRHAVAA